MGSIGITVQTLWWEIRLAGTGQRYCAGGGDWEEKHEIRRYVDGKRVYVNDCKG